MTLIDKIRGIAAGRGYYITDVAYILERSPEYVRRLYSGRSKLNLNDLHLLSQKFKLTFVITNDKIKIKPNDKQNKKQNNLRPDSDSFNISIITDAAKTRNKARRNTDPITD